MRIPLPEEEKPTLAACELGPIRPPSEATSLLLRVTRNCPWNRCTFCAVYKGARFSKRPLDELLAEIDLLANAALSIKRRAALRGELGAISPAAALSILREPGLSDDERRMALWLHRGAGQVFLQDADSLVRPPGEIAQVLNRLREALPGISRVTTYARSRTLAARSKEQLAELRSAGLVRIHVGVESGSDEVLAYIDKGCRAEHHIAGCKAAIEAGFEVCCYVMPGLGGQLLSSVHADETARVLRDIDPHHIRLRTLWIDPGSPLERECDKGAFSLLEDEDVVREIQRLVRGLTRCRGHLISDHDRNLLGDIEGHLTNDAALLDARLEAFLGLPDELRDAFVVGRRAGYFGRLDSFLAQPAAAGRFAELAVQLRAEGNGSLAEGMRRRFRRLSI